MIEAILSFFSAWGLQQEPYEAEERFHFEVIILCQTDLNYIKDYCELVLIVPGEVSVGFAQCNDSLVLLTHVEHLLNEFRVWEEKVSLLLQNFLEFSALIKLIWSVKRHVGANSGSTMSIASDHVGHSFKYVLVLGYPFSESLQSLLLDQLLELSHLLLVLDSGQAHLWVRIVNWSDVAHVSVVLMVRRNIIEEELQHSAYTLGSQEKLSDLRAKLNQSRHYLKVLGAMG